MIQPHMNYDNLFFLPFSITVGAQNVVIDLPMMNFQGLESLFIMISCCMETQQCPKNIHLSPKFAHDEYLLAILCCYSTVLVLNSSYSCCYLGNIVYQRNS